MIPRDDTTWRLAASGARPDGTPVRLYRSIVGSRHELAVGATVTPFACAQRVDALAAFAREAGWTLARASRCSHCRRSHPLALVGRPCPACGLEALPCPTLTPRAAR